MESKPVDQSKHDRKPAPKRSRGTASIRSAVHVRWMIRRDMPEVMGIEEQSFEFPWGEEDFIGCLRQRNCIGMVAETAEAVVGFVVYELRRESIHVLNLAVARTHRRLGVGAMLVEKIVGKLAPDHRGRVCLEVRERNLPAQLFFRSNGFLAVSVLKDFYRDTTEDAYHMERCLPGAEQPAIRRKAG